MLFSNDEVAEYINKTFEPAWETVRSALLVTIEFGNGQSMKRTLQGNVATYVCRSDGIVCDVLPGIYTPPIYLEQLRSLRQLFDSVGTAPESVALARLLDYHTQRIVALSKRPAPTPAMQAVGFTGGGGKFGIEGGLQRAIASKASSQPSPNLAQAAQGSSVLVSGAGLAGGNAGQLGIPPIASYQGPLATRPDLVLDAQVNERIRRKAVHEKLASLGGVRPPAIKHWLFKEVLHVDLDDPQLGLGKTLTESYPFTEEDRAVERQSPKKVQ